MCLSKGLFPLRLRVDSKESRRTKCCESVSFWATRLCWVLDFVRRDVLCALSRLRAVKAGGVALLQASMAHFHRVDTLQPKLGTKYFFFVFKYMLQMYLNTFNKYIQILNTLMHFKILYKIFSNFDLFNPLTFLKWIVY